MASLVYSNAIKSILEGDIDFGGAGEDTFKLILVTSAYTPDKANHQFRSEVTGESVEAGSPPDGSGYIQGGLTTTPGDVTINGDNIEITFTPVVFSEATTAANAAVIYQDTGDAATDRLIAYLDFEANVESSSGTFTVSTTTPLTINNS